MRQAGLWLLLLAQAVGAAAQTTLDQAHDAFRQGRWNKAVQLFAQAAEEESDPRSRAEIRVKLAWTYFFALKNRSKAEQTLRQALQEAPDLEIIPDLYTDEFVDLFNRVKSRAAAPPPVAATPKPVVAAAGLPALRARLASAVDAMALEALLAEAKALEASQGPASFPDLLELEGDILDRLGRPGEALRLRSRAQALRIASQTAPGTPVVPLELIRQARQFLVAGQPQDAIALLQGVLDALPSCTPAFEVLAQAYLEAGAFDEAYSALQTAIISSENPELYLALGELELARQRPAAARDAFRKAINLDPANDRALAAAGLLAASLQDYASAKELLEHALKSNGTLFEARVVRAQLALMEGQTQEAISHLLRALQVRPQDPWATGWLGVAYLAAGDAKAAASRLEEAAKPGQDFRLFAAEAALRLKDSKKVLQLLSADDPDPQAQLLRARAFLASGQAEAALELLQQLVRLFPADGAARTLLGYTHFQLGQWEAAARTLREAEGLKGSPPWVAQGRSWAEKAAAAQALMTAALVPPPPPPRR